VGGLDEADADNGFALMGLQQCRGPSECRAAAFLTELTYQFVWRGAATNAKGRCDGRLHRNAAVTKGVAGANYHPPGSA